MTKNRDQPRFYNALCKLGPQTLLGIDNSTREVIAEVALSTDTFWSDGLEDSMAQNATGHDTMRASILSVLELWKENVLLAIDSDFGIELDWNTGSIDSTSPLIDELVEAAKIQGRKAKLH